MSYRNSMLGQKQEKLDQTSAAATKATPLPLYQ
jgi:hypothetical protein